MGGDEVDARPRLAAAAVEQVARTRDAARELRQHAVVALPVGADRVAELVVPLGPARRELADLIAARADVPRLGDQLDAAQHRVLAAHVEEAAALVEAVRLAGEDRGKVEAEAVDAHFVDPVAQRIRHHLEHPRMRQVHRVPGAGVVDVVALLVGQQPVVIGVVDALLGERGAQFVAFGGVIVDHVEDYLDAGIVELVDHLLELVDERRLEIARCRGEEGEAVIAPVVLQPLLDQVAVVDEGVDRQELGRGDAERPQIFGDARMGETGEGAALGFGNAGVELGEALYMHLVGDRALPRHHGMGRRAPGEGRIDDPAFGHQMRAVLVVEGQVLVGMVELVAEQLRTPFQVAHQLLGIGVDQQLVGVEAVAGLGLVGAVDAETVDGARPRFRQIAVPDLVGIFGQFDPLALGDAVIVEQAEFDLGGVGREDGEVDAETIPCGAEGEGPPFADHGALLHLRGGLPGRVDHESGFLGKKAGSNAGPRGPVPRAQALMCESVNLAVTMLPANAAALRERRNFRRRRVFRL